jgi:hypothetical protein
MSLVKEDWERIHLMDTIYLNEIALQEEINRKTERQPAEIILLTPIKEKKDETLSF